MFRSSTVWNFVYLHHTVQLSITKLPGICIPNLEPPTQKLRIERIQHRFLRFAAT